MFGLVHLVHPVEDGMAGVQLDGGEDSLTGRGSGRGSNGSGSNVGGIGSRWDHRGGRGGIRSEQRHVTSYANKIRTRQ